MLPKVNCKISNLCNITDI